MAQTFRNLVAESTRWHGKERREKLLHSWTQVQLPLCLPHVCAHSCTLPISTSLSPSPSGTHVDGVQSQELYSLKFWVWLWAERTSYWSWRFIELIASRKTKSNIYSLRYILFFWKNASYHCSETWNVVPLMSPVSGPLLRGCVTLVCLEACRCILVKLHAKFGCVGNLKYQSCGVSHRF